MSKVSTIKIDSFGRSSECFVVLVSQSSVTKLDMAMQLTMYRMTRASVLPCRWAVSFGPTSIQYFIHSGVSEAILTSWLVREGASRFFVSRILFSVCLYIFLPTTPCRARTSSRSLATSRSSSARKLTAPPIEYFIKDDPSSGLRCKSQQGSNGTFGSDFVDTPTKFDLCSPLHRKFLFILHTV